MPSKSEGRRLIQQGGISVNGEKVTDPFFVVVEEMFEDGHMMVKRGKKNFYKVEIE